MTQAYKGRCTGMIDASITVVTMLRSSQWISVDNTKNISYLLMLSFLYRPSELIFWMNLLKVAQSFIITRVFCPQAGPSLQEEKPRLQMCRRQVLHCKLKKQGCSFTRDLIGAVTSRCFLHPTLSLASKQAFKYMKRSQGHQRGGEESGFG